MAQTHSTPYTIPVGQVPSTQTSFPALVYASGVQFKDIGNGGHVQTGNDVRPYADSSGSPNFASPYVYRMVYYDPVGGIWIGYVLVTAADGLKIHLGYGDAALSSDGSSTSTFPQVGKWLLGDGSTLDLTDATANAGNGTNNSATATPGKISGGAALSGTAQYFTVADNNRYSFTNGSADSAFTLSSWVKLTDITAANPVIDKYKPSGQREYVFGFLSSNLYAWVFDESTGGLRGRRASGVGSWMSNGTWALVHMTYDGSGTNGGVKIYINGVQRDDTDFTGGSYTCMQNGTGDLGFGRDNTGVGGPLTGSLDEPGIWGSVLTQNWVTSEYNNQFAPTTFWTQGSEVAVGGSTPVFTINRLFIPVPGPRRTRVLQL